MKKRNKNIKGSSTLQVLLVTLYLMVMGGFEGKSPAPYEVRGPSDMTSQRGSIVRGYPDFHSVTITYKAQKVIFLLTRQNNQNANSPFQRE